MRYAYFPGCSLEATAVNYDQSTRAVARALGIDLEEIPDWNCCGATSAHMTNHLLALALPARNLAIAEKQGLDVVAPCAACFNRLITAAHALKRDQLLARRVNRLVGEDYRGQARVLPFLGAVVREYGLERIEERLGRRLKGLKVASYYGCLLVRPVEITSFDDPENPTVMDRLVETLGATAVDWAFKTECCGASLAITRTEIMVHLVGNILAAAKAAGADCVVTACPFCHANLDMRQVDAGRARGVRFDLPVYYFTDLLGLALGLSPGDLGLKKNIVDPMPLLREKVLAV